MHLPSNLVAQGFARDNSDFLAYPLVRMEIQSETWIILLDDKLRGLFDRLRSDTTLQIVKRQNKPIIRRNTILLFYICTIVMDCTA